MTVSPEEEAIDALSAEIESLDKRIASNLAKVWVAPKRPVPRMQKREIPMILTLATALKLLLASSTTRAHRQRGAQLLYEYLLDYKEVSVVSGSHKRRGHVSATTQIVSVRALESITGSVDVPPVHTLVGHARRVPPALALTTTDAVMTIAGNTARIPVGTAMTSGGQRMIASVHGHVLTSPTTMHP